MKRTIPFLALALAALGAPLVAQTEAPDMEAMMAAAQPGEQHEMLTKMVGDWSYTSQMWMAPGSPPMETDGVMKAETLLDGRFVKAVWASEMMGMPFKGIGINGYDNVKGKFTNVWMDNMGTMMMMFEGDCVDEACSGTSLEAPFTDPATGAEMTMRMVSSWKSDDQFSVEGFMVTPDGNEFKSMVLEVKRK